MKTNEPNLSWYQVPGEIENLLRSAAQSWENTQESEHYMQEAIALGDTNKEITAKVNVTFAPGVISPIHNHGTWGVVAVL
jgi:predicted metal-dependent enzyme (double-stranded beta helix superfamily)